MSITFFFSCLSTLFTRHTSCIAWEDSPHPTLPFCLKLYFHMAPRKSLQRSQCCTAALSLTSPAQKRFSSSSSTGETPQLSCSYVSFGPSCTSCSWKRSTGQTLESVIAENYPGLVRQQGKHIFLSANIYLFPPIPYALFHFSVQENVLVHPLP